MPAGRWATAARPRSGSSAAATGRTPSAPKAAPRPKLEERGDPRGEYLRLWCRALRDARRLRELRAGIAPDWLRQVHRDGSFQLDCGRRVSVDAFYCRDTYIGLLEGLPDRRLNEETLERVRAQMRPLWGERKTCLVPRSSTGPTPSTRCCRPSA